MSASTKIETRVPCSKPTLIALRSYKRGGEAYDTLLRRMLISGVPKPFSTLTPQEQAWVLNQTGGHDE